MAIDRFILSKLVSCKEENVRNNLLALFLIRVEQALYKEEAHRAVY